MQIITASSINKTQLIPSTIFFGALLILVSVLPFSEYVISVSQFTIAGAWLLSLDFKNKFQRLYQNKIFWVLAGLALIHLIGMVYTDVHNMKYALKDIRIKVPLLLLPLLFASSKPLSKKQFKTVLFFFIAAVFCATVFSVGIKHNLWGPSSADYRDTSIFISHIRFALMICFCIYILLYFIFSNSFSTSKTEMIIYIILIIWFSFVLYHIPYLTGAIILPMVAITSFFILIFKKCSPFQKLISISFVVLLPVFALYYLNNISKEIYLNDAENLEELESVTALGNPYEHSIDNMHAENGNRVWIYVCNEELEKEWNKRSTINYQDNDLTNQNIKYTLIRFLASKGLRKDSAGVQSLTDEEINAIENGKANVNLLQGATIHNRLYQVVWEYEMYKIGMNPSGHSLFMRVEYVKTAFHIIKENILLGIGTGNIVEAYETAYEETNSRLEKRFQRRTHNQYLTFMVCFGVLGLSYFIFSLLYPVFYFPNQFKSLYIIFILIVAFSMFTEDTLETQVGVTFYAFFNTLFLFLAPPKKDPLIS